MRNLVVFSTHNQLYVTFQTLKRTAQVFNRGFFGVYEFSEDYVKLGKPLGWAGPGRSLTSSFYFQISSRIQMRSTFGEPSVTRRSSARGSPAGTCSVLTTHFRIRSETFQMILIFTKHKMHFIHSKLNMKLWLGWWLMFQHYQLLFPIFASDCGYLQRYIVCRYFIYGMQDSQNLERVVLAFDKFDIPAGKQINKWVGAPITGN